MIKIIFGIILLFFLFYIASGTISSLDTRLKIVVCDVGQGDGIYIRTPDGKDILFDGGPDGSISSCLKRYMPFFDRKIELAILSHPHLDHYYGYFQVLEHYKIEQFVTEDVLAQNKEFKEFYQAVADEEAEWMTVYEGDKIVLDEDVYFEVLGPTKSFREGKRSSSGVVDPSDVSLQLLLTYKTFNFLLLGDSNTDQIQAITSDLPEIEMMQTPHHGSRNGMTKELAEKFSPDFVTISSGEKNRYGHPNKEVLQFYNDLKIPILRTDQKGDLRLFTDGVSYNMSPSLP